MQRAFTPIAALSVMLPLMADGQTFTRSEAGGFTVIGLAARTSNAQEMSAKGVIGELWRRVRAEGALNGISNRLGTEIIALYTDYQSDKEGPYTYLLGVKVANIQKVPAGMTVRQVPSGEYAVLAVRDHPAPTAVIGLWQQVWSLETSRQISRAYGTDFEVHHMNGATETAVELYVGTKK